MSLTNVKTFYELWPAYVAATRRTAKEQPPAELFNHGVLGFISEYVEWRKGKRARNHSNCREEAGDMLWYCAEAVCSYPGPVVPVLMANADELDVIGQAADMAKRWLIYGKCPSESEHYTILSSMLAIAHECVLLTYLGDNPMLEVIMEQNNEKLRLRYPDKFTQAAALARADKGPNED